MFIYFILKNNIYAIAEIGTSFINKFINKVFYLKILIITKVI